MSIKLPAGIVNVNADVHYKRLLAAAAAKYDDEDVGGSKATVTKTEYLNTVVCAEYKCRPIYTSELRSLLLILS